MIACLVQGVATATSPHAGMLIAGFIGIYVASRMFFIDHPALWWYLLVFFGVLISVAAVGAGIFAGVCAVLPQAGVMTRACQSLSLGRALLQHISVSTLSGGLLWLSLRLWLWWKLR